MSGHATQLLAGLIAEPARWTLPRLQVPGRHAAAELIGRCLPATERVVTVDGLRMQLDLRDHLQRQVFFNLYEPGETALIRSIVRPGSTCIDIGANIGYFTLLMARLAGNDGCVHAFEPVPSNYELIQTNAALNGMHNIRVVQAAVSAGSGSISLYLDAASSETAYASIVRSDGQTEIKVDCLALDAYIVEHIDTSIDFIKIDAEGSEPQILAGMQHCLTSAQPPQLLIEVNPFLLQRLGHTNDDVLAPLREAGFDLQRVGQKHLEPLGEIRNGEVVNVLARRQS